MIEPEVSASVAVQSVQHLLRCLGWQYSCDPEKDKPFDAVFDVLGVRVNVAQLYRGSFTMANKDGRIVEAKGLVMNMIKAGTKHPQVVHGLSNFMSGLVLGQSLKVLRRAIAQRYQQVCLGTRTGLLNLVNAR